MKKCLNKVHVEGRIFSHSLKAGKVENEKSPNFGQAYISGAVNIAVDDACSNVVTINYTYVPEKFKSGAENKTYTELKKILSTGKTVEADGKELATIVKADSAIGLNDFYTEKDGKETLVAAKKNEGGFITVGGQLRDEKDRSTFSVDMYINGVREVPVEDGDDYIMLEGAIFDFRGAILPVSLPVRGKDGISYFNGLGISKQNPTFRNIWGTVMSTRLVTKAQNSSENAAFGKPQVKEYVNTRREWLVTGASSGEYELNDSEAGITPDELKKALSDREVHLADVKQRYEDYKKNKAANMAAPQSGSFDF